MPECFAELSEKEKYADREPELGTYSQKYFWTNIRSWDRKNKQNNVFFFSSQHVCTIKEMLAEK